MVGGQGLRGAFLRWRRGQVQKKELKYKLKHLTNVPRKSIIIVFININ